MKVSHITFNCLCNRHYDDTLLATRCSSQNLLRLTLYWSLYSLLYILWNFTTFCGAGRYRQCTCTCAKQRYFFHGCQWMAKVPNGVEKLRKISTAWLGRTIITDRQADRQTDGRHIITYSEREREFTTFAKKESTECSLAGSQLQPFSTSNFGISLQWRQCWSVSHVITLSHRMRNVLKVADHMC